jgi:hypothetical protein
LSSLMHGTMNLKLVIFIRQDVGTNYTTLIHTFIFNSWQGLQRFCI